MISNKNITPQIVKEIIEKGKTKTIKGFTSKAGKKFNAKLKLTEKVLSLILIRKMNI